MKNEFDEISNDAKYDKIVLLSVEYDNFISQAMSCNVQNEANEPTFIFVVDKICKHNYIGSNIVELKADIDKYEAIVEERGKKPEVSETDKKVRRICINYKLLGIDYGLYS